MAVQTTLHITHHTPAGETNANTRTLTVPRFNWSQDWTKIEGNRGVTLINTSSPLNAPFKVRFEKTNVNNIYEGSSILANYQMPTKRGIKFFAQTSAIASTTDSADPLFEAQLPLVANLTLRVPVVSGTFLTDSQLAAIVANLIGSLLSTNVNETLVDSVPRFLRGSLDPTEW